MSPSDSRAALSVSNQFCFVLFFIMDWIIQVLVEMAIYQRSTPFLRSSIKSGQFEYQIQPISFDNRYNAFSILVSNSRLSGLF